MTNKQPSHAAIMRRPLDSLEEHFWLLEKITARGHAMAIRLKGSASEENWRAAFQQVQLCHPMLSVSIEKRPGERPFFNHVPNRPIPIGFLNLTDAVSLESFVEAELLRSFGAGQDSLTRVTVFRGDRQSAVVITSHHAALDGKDHLSILQEALAVLDGGHIERPCSKSLPPSTSSRFHRMTPPYSGRFPLNDGDPPLQSIHAIAPVRIVRRVVDEQIMASILRACRSRQVTFHSSLLTALARAGFRFNDQWRRDGIRALTPVNVRPCFDLDGAVGMCMVLHRTVFENGTSFWDDAESLNHSLKPSEIPQIADACFTLAEELVAEEHSPTSHLARIAGTGFAHDLMLTNYGTLDWKGTNEFQIEDMFTAGIAGHIETQKVAAVTRDGSLFLTMVSQSPIPNFLETATEELVAASAATN